MTNTPIDRERLLSEANSYRVYGANWFADQIETLLAALDEAEARAESAAQEARAAALKEAADLVWKRSGPTLCKEVKALLNTPAAEALERVRAEERESCARVAETEEAEMQKVADFHHPPRIDCDTYLADLHEQGAIVAARIAAAIRARGEKQ